MLFHSFTHSVVASCMCPDQGLDLQPQLMERCSSDLNDPPGRHLFSFRRLLKAIQFSRENIEFSQVLASCSFKILKKYIDNLESDGLCLWPHVSLYFRNTVRPMWEGLPWRVHIHRPHRHGGGRWGSYAKTAASK